MGAELFMNIRGYLWEWNIKLKKKKRISLGNRNYVLHEHQLVIHLVGVQVGAYHRNNDYTKLGTRSCSIEKKTKNFLPKKRSQSLTFNPRTFPLFFCERTDKKENK